ncbi:MAG: XkdF-like putative serine protease domain-containing protein [Bdellovibrionota bacterium]
MLKNFFSVYLMDCDQFQLQPTRKVQAECDVGSALEWVDAESPLGFIAKTLDGAYGDGWKMWIPEESKSEIEVRIRKIDDDKQLVYGVVLEPETIDAQGDIISDNEVIERPSKIL